MHSYMFENNTCYIIEGVISSGLFVDLSFDVIKIESLGTEKRTCIVRRWHALEFAIFVQTEEAIVAVTAAIYPHSFNKEIICSNECQYKIQIVKKLLQLTCRFS